MEQQPFQTGITGLPAAGRKAKQVKTKYDQYVNQQRVLTQSA